MPENKRHITEVEEPDRSPPSTRVQRSLPLEIGPDDLTDANHQDLDARVIDRVGYDRDEELSPNKCRSLLMAIVEESDGMFDCDGKKAKALLQEYPGLVDMLKEAWKSQRFRTIRNLAILQSEQPTDDTRNRAIGDLKPAPDDSNDTTHEALDFRVVKRVADIAGYGRNEELNLDRCRIILLVIVQESDGRLSCDAKKAKALLEEFPELADMLKEAWKNQRFRKIRNLATLRSSHSISRLSDAPALVQAVASAWEGTFSGDRHQLLLQNLHKMWYEKRHLAYSNTVAVIQSSGSGKSRMVHEQAKLVFTLPFNLRQSSDNNGLAYPSPDDQVRDHLTKVSGSFEKTRTRFVFFFKCLFAVVKEELRHKFGNNPIKGSVENFATAWHEHLGSEGNRTRLYKEVVERCEAGQSTIVGDQDAETKQSLKDLIEVIEQHCDLAAADDKLKVILYFDEAHVLAGISAGSGEKKYNHYEAVGSALTSFIGDPVFAIFLSTQSSLNLLAPPSRLCRSARARDTRDCLQAPITETPFDCSTLFRIKPGELTISDITKIEFLVQFGRPMFWSMLNASMEKSAVCSSMINFARSKLTHSQLHDVGTVPLTHEVLMVLLDVLIMLDFAPHHEASHRHQVEGVAKHMRTAYSVPAHRTYLRSGYSSEPILAEAAAQEIRHAQKKDPRVNIMTITLLQCLDNGLISPGERGEAVMRLILIQAYMNAVVKENPSGPGFIFSKGCRVSTFIKELFAERHVESILGSLPDNVVEDTERSIKLDTAFSKSIVRFTHFAKAADESVLDVEALFAAFVRGMAFIGSTSQEAVDLIIPILLDSDRRLEPSAMSVLLVQVKRRKVAGTINQYLIDEAKLELFPAAPELEAKTPYLTLVAELGIGGKPTKKKAPPAQQRSQTPEQGHVPIPLETPSKLKINTPPQRGGRRHADPHPRYSIRAYGCSSTVYNVISFHDKAVYQALLAKGDLFLEHARQDSESQKAVKSLKPHWHKGEPFDWVDCAIRYGKGKEEVEYVEVGQATFDD